MKRIAAFALAGVLLATAFSGCGGSSTASSQTEAQSNDAVSEIVPEITQDDNADYTLLSSAQTLTAQDLSFEVPGGWSYCDRSDLGALWLKGPNDGGISIAYSKDTTLDLEKQDAQAFFSTLDNDMNITSPAPEPAPITVGNQTGEQLTGYYTTIELSIAYVFVEYNGYVYTMLCTSTPQSAHTDLMYFKSDIIPNMVFA